MEINKKVETDSAADEVALEIVEFLSNKNLTCKQVATALARARVRVINHAEAIKENAIFKINIL